MSDKTTAQQVADALTGIENLLPVHIAMALETWADRITTPTVTCPLDEWPRRIATEAAAQATDALTVCARLVPGWNTNRARVIIERCRTLEICAGLPLLPAPEEGGI